ncbi:MAG TPA: hypothetical protein PLE45_05250 [Spirochaetota bacterium]|nr:hypothetical protein [Spirochaetota bacterium]HOL56745.1 hypothetical protein [Spirochaetota bacterium]HPP04162.1 hypothetical protein [Spirochaetota bacterium]
MRFIIEEFLEEYEKFGIEKVFKRCTGMVEKLFLKILNLKRCWKKKELSHFQRETILCYKVIYNYRHQALGFKIYF